ncbi:MAG: hypothetical protein QOF89_3091 [Acidobacteriota bacterium]|jgi:hypothetical protein|nr:hypothetical protein [Acidobacteriota bacterium]
MGWITIDLDEETEARMKASAKAHGVSPARWIMGLIHQKLAKLAGGSADAPSLEEFTDGAPDISRET